MFLRCLIFWDSRFIMSKSTEYIRPDGDKGTEWESVLDNISSINATAKWN